MTQHKKQGLRSFFSYTSAMVGAAAAVTAFNAAPAWAQDAAEEEDVIVVTGTRIQRPDYQFTNPVVSSTAEEIENSGNTNLLDYLETIPSLNNSTNGMEQFTSASGFAGVDLLNLRNLGVDRTLVLVDGKRHVSGSIGSSAVDVSSIPTDLVERVDVLTGGASAIYGADGVSGVVNFILRDDFEGLRIRAQAGAPEEDGQNTEFVSLVGGLDLADGRGNLSASVEYSNETRLMCLDRDFCRRDARFVSNPAASFGGPFQRIPLDNLVWFSSGIGGAYDTDGDFYIGNFDGATDAAWDFGTDFDPPNGVFDSGFTYGQGGSGTPVPNYTETLLPAFRSLNVNLFGHFDITNDMRLYGSVKMVSSESFFNGQPSFDYAYALDVDENPFIIGTDTALDAIANGEDYTYGSRDQFDLGYQGEILDRNVARVVVGIDGNLTESVRYDLSYSAGQLSEDLTNTNTRFEDRFAAAIDVVIGPGGVPTCRVNVNPAAYLASYNLNDREATSGQSNYPAPISFSAGPASGCQPLNVFGIGVGSPAAVDWIMNDTHTKSRVNQQVAGAALSGDFGTFLELPGGSIGWAVGAEWRRESLTSTPDAALLSGVTGTTILASEGGYESTDVFVEASLPLLRDAPFAQSLTLDWAHRYAEYSTLGATNTWKFGLSWQPVDWLSFRATRAEAVRAPNINELFAPQQTAFAFITDPCDAAQLASAPDVALRTANCNVLLSAASAPAAGAYLDPFAAFQKTGRQGGNPGLGVETAETDTFGIIFRPTFLSGFTFSADYYDIVLLDAINLTDPQDLANNCVDAPSTVGNPFCDGVIRQVGGGGAGGIIDYLAAPFNVANYTTRGIDFTAAYNFDAADIGLGDRGEFTIRAVGNNTQELTFVPLVGAARNSDLAESSSFAPEWQLNVDITWEIGPWTTTYGYNFSTDMLRNAGGGLEENDAWAANPLYVAEEYKYVEGVRSHNLQVRYNVNDQFEIYGGANNLGYEVDLGGYGRVYAPNGQFFYLGAVARFGG